MRLLFLHTSTAFALEPLPQGPGIAEHAAALLAENFEEGRLEALKALTDLRLGLRILHPLPNGRPLRFANSDQDRPHLDG